MKLPFITRASHRGYTELLLLQIGQLRGELQSERAKTWQLTRDIIAMKQDGFTQGTDLTQYIEPPLTVDEQDALRAQEMDDDGN